MSALAGCAGKAGPSAAVVREREAKLVEFLAGGFDSTKQHAQDPENYFDIRLHHVPIWTDRTDGKWLYVEQAVATAIEKPYRQRVYRITSDPATNTYQSHIHEIHEPQRFALGWQDTSKLAALKPEDLMLKDGCTVYLTFHPCSDMFTGETRGTGCTSTLRGASYAMSEMSITEAGIVAWDRGMTTDGKQVWGPEKGGYYFVKQR